MEKRTFQEFVELAKKKHNGKYEYIESTYVNNCTKMLIICPNHGEFWQSPKNHLRYGCQKCAREYTGICNKLTTEEFISKAIKKHGNKYDYSKVEYIDNTTPVTIICPKHGEFKQTPTKHLTTNGCSLCSIENRGNKKRFTFEMFKDKIVEKYGDVYDLSKTVYVNSRTPVTIICKKHGEFIKTPNEILHSCGCVNCKKEENVKKIIKQPKIIDKRAIFIEKSILVHGNKYDYSKVEYVNSNTKVCIICPEHGEFWQTPHLHLAGHGCKKCKCEITAKKRSLSQDEFIAKAVSVHGDRYDYTKTIYKSKRNKVTITCRLHGDFTQLPLNHARGQGCPVCGKKYASEFRKNDYNSFIKESKERFGDKFDFPDIEKLYVNSHSKIKLRCKECGNVFYKIACDHLTSNKGGCLKCNANKSYAEDCLSNYISEIYNGESLMRCRNAIDGYELDIFLPELKFAIEYNGLFWHCVERKSKNYHLNKLELCQRKGIKLIQVFEDEYISRKEIVEDKIRHLLKLDNNKERIYARKCYVKEITFEESKEFLDVNHIQGHVSASVYLGCFHNTTLIGVMQFKKEGNGKYDLNRFATDINYNCIGVGGKLFKYFRTNYSPEEVKSFADRRWTVNETDNLYVKLGFKFDKYIAPDYRYFFKSNKERFHKFGFRKSILSKKYGLPLTMTEKEMTDKIGAHRIYDCGLIKYIWKNGQNGE